MELDHIAYIDIVQICAVILAPSKLLTRCSLHCSSAPPLSCTEGGGAGTDTQPLFNKHGGSNNVCGACGGGIG